MRLDARSVAALNLDGKTDAIFFDDDLPGFGFRLRLSAGGRIRKSWVAQYRRAGSSRRLLLGAGDVLTAEQARGMAKRALAKVALGEDPQADRLDRRDKDRVSVRSMVDEYLADKEREVRPRTLRELKRYLLGGFFKPLHSMPVDTVTRRDIAARLVAITREHGAIVAARSRAALSTFFVWGMQMGIVEHNAVVGTIQPKGGKRRERTLSDDELAAIWRACKDDDYGRIIRLLILLGARRQEVGGIAWSELDLERGLWKLPEARSKNKLKHELPLLPMALGILKDVPRLVLRDQLFGARSSDGFTGWDGQKAALDERSNVRGWILHDVRRTFSTRLNDLGVAPHVVEQILNHQSHRGQVGGVYNKSPYANEVCSALALWEDFIRTLVEGGERKVIHIAPVAAS
jgi:integrase